jgi:hypothetical protein
MNYFFVFPLSGKLGNYTNKLIVNHLTHVLNKHDKQIYLYLLLHHLVAPK